MSVIRPRTATLTLAGLALALPLTGGAGEPPGAAPATGAAALNVDAVAAAIVQRLALQPGERVLLVGTRGRFDALVLALRREVVQAGEEDLGAWMEEGPTPTAWETDFIRHLGETRSDRLVEVLADVDAGVDRVYQRALLETDDDALAAHQRAFEEAMWSAVVRVTTPAGTDLRFRIGDRPVTRQDGDASASRATRARNLIGREIELPLLAIPDEEPRWISYYGYGAGVVRLSLGACPSKGVGRARGAFACSAKERRRVVAALRRGGATMDQPRTHHVPIHLQDHDIEACGLGAARPRLRRWRSST